jgi:hypothetical protein
MVNYEKSTFHTCVWLPLLPAFKRQSSPLQRSLYETLEAFGTPPITLIYLWRHCRCLSAHNATSLNTCTTVYDATVYYALSTSRTRLKRSRGQYLFGKRFPCVQSGKRDVCSLPERCINLRFEERILPHAKSTKSSAPGNWGTDYKWEFVPACIGDEWIIGQLSLGEKRYLYPDDTLTAHSVLWSSITMPIVLGY